MITTETREIRSLRSPDKPGRMYTFHIVSGTVEAVETFKQYALVGPVAARIVSVDGTRVLVGQGVEVALTVGQVVTARCHAAIRSDGPYVADTRDSVEVL